MGAMGRRQSLAVLEAAYDAGIRHFDTAPLYGYGDSESCVGEFLGRRRGDVTVTTKFGLLPQKSGGLVRSARMIAGPVLQRLPGLKQRLQAAMHPSRSRQHEAARTPNPVFNAELARASLERSLANLRTDRIDVWLLHEVRAIDLASDPRNDSLLRLMGDSIREGKVGAFGVGSNRNEVPELLARHPEYCRVVQYDWSVFDAAVPPTPYLRMHHSAISGRFTDLVDWLKTHSEQRKRWSDDVGEDLGKPERLAQLMLKASYRLNPASVVLFSSKQPARIQANVACLEDSGTDAPAQRLYELVQREKPLG